MVYTKAWYGLWRMFVCLFVCYWSTGVCSGSNQKCYVGIFSSVDRLVLRLYWNFVLFLVKCRNSILNSSSHIVYYTEINSSLYEKVVGPLTKRSVHGPIIHSIINSFVILWVAFLNKCFLKQMFHLRRLA